MLNNRELAALIWLGVAFLWILSTKGGRKGFVQIATAFLKLQILIPLVAMLVWVGIELWVGARLGLWNPTLAKSTTLWILGSAGVLLFNSTQLDSDSEPHFFHGILGRIETWGTSIDQWGVTKAPLERWNSDMYPNPKPTSGAGETRTLDLTIMSRTL